MAKPKERRYKLGRNDLCWCGSGRKYKDCHIPIEQTERREQRNLEEAQELLLPKIAAAAQEIPEAFPGALALFWNNAYTVEQMSELDDLEDHGAVRFMTWCAFDYPLEDGRTLVERLDDNANQGEFGTNEFELRLLHEWRNVRLRPYIVEGIRKGQSLVVRDMFDAERYAEVKDHHASKRMEVGEVMVAHLIPVGKRNAGLPPLLPQTDSPPDEEVPPQKQRWPKTRPYTMLQGRQHS